MNIVVKALPVCLALLVCTLAQAQSAPERVTTKPESDATAAAMPEKRPPPAAKAKPAKSNKPAPVRSTIKPEPDIQAPVPKPDESSKPGPVRSTIRPEPDIQAPAPKPDESVQSDKADRPDKNARAKPPLRRRAVTQIIEPAYRPTLTVPAPAIGQPPAPTFGLPAAALAPPPSGPVQLNCNSTGCSDAAGTRYNGGIGNALIDSNGRSCTRVGTTAQCF